MRLPRLALVLAVLGALADPVLAHEVTPAEKRTHPYSADLPSCGDPNVLANITSAFAEKESQFWRSTLTILEYEHIRPVAWRPGGLDLIPRRFCTASATVSDGRRRRIDYSVREDLDYLGAGWGVEWCVTGLDRNWAFQPACRMARP